MQESPPYKRSCLKIVGCSSPFRRPAEHLTALRGWCYIAMSPWSVKSRRALSRRCRDARVYGHTTTAMHDNEYIPPTLRPRVGMFLEHANYSSSISYCNMNGTGTYIHELYVLFYLQ